MNVAVLVSGGVDSSVALRLVRDQGHQVTAFYLKIWLEDELAYLGTCPWEEDVRYVQEVCAQLGVPLQVVNLQQEYWDRVVAYAIREIKAGRTPNPDMLCNREIKFGAFYDRYGKEFDAVATGHYAQTYADGSRVYLRMAPDPVKDQTYFLARLTQEQIKKALFPIGHLTKAQVRELARTYDLPTKDRKDSQGICFLGKIPFAEFVKHHCGTLPGPLVEVETGVVVGEHPGFFYFTIGQRHGIGLAGGPWYVERKDPVTNTVYISKNYYDQAKKRDVLTLKDVVLLQALPQSGLTVKIRHGALRHEVAAVSQHDDKLTIALGKSDQGLASGQFAVLYSGDLCIGSGVIE